MRKKGRGGAATQSREGGEWVGGRTGGATRNSYQLIIIEQGEEKKKRELADEHGKLACCLEAGS